MRVRRKGHIITSIVILSLMMSPIFGPKETKATNPGPFFSITILVPNTTTERIDIANLFAEELPKIGIQVDSVVQAGWSEITSRCWTYPGPYPIPTFAEGGYDVLFQTWNMDFDFKPDGFYDSPSITPVGNNFYQYSNPLMDSAVENHSSSMTVSDRVDAASAIQNIAYEDLPSIAIAYPELVYPHNESLIGWDSFLWSTIYQPIIGWSLAEKTELHYAVPYSFYNFHPYDLVMDHDALWVNQIYTPLIRRNASEENHFSPMVAQVFTSSDGLNYIVKIKDDAVWADNTPITTDDVIYSYNISKYVGLISDQPWNFQSITKTNDKEFILRFSSQYVYQDSSLALNLIPKHIWESVPAENHEETALNWSIDHPEKMFGAGPYKLKEYDNVSEVIHLEKNPYFDDWFGLESTFDDIYFELYGSASAALTALESGTVDMVDGNFNFELEDLDLPGVQYDRIASGSVYEMAINNEHPYIGSGELCPIASAESAKHIRKAMNYVLDRAKICEDVFDGKAALGVTIWPSSSIDFDTSLAPVDYNLDYARYHMSQAGLICQYNSTPPYATSASPTVNFGLSTATILGFMVLIGTTILIVNKRRK